MSPFFLGVNDECAFLNVVLDPQPAYGVVFASGDDSSEWVFRFLSGFQMCPQIVLYQKAGRQHITSFLRSQLHRLLALKGRC